MRGDKTRCVTCGKEYSVCPRCGDAAWRKTACSPVCWQICQIINQHFYGLIDAVKAKEELEHIHYERVALREDNLRQVSLILEQAAAHKPKKVRKARPQAVHCTAEDADETQANA